MKFIKKNGRIIPINDDAKKPSKKQMDKNYKKYGDGANQSARIMSKYEKKADLIAGKFEKAAIVGILGGGLSYLYGGKKTGLALMGIGAFSAGVGHSKRADYMKKNESNIESDHVRAFGVGSAGEKVQQMKKLKKKKK